MFESKRQMKSDIKTLESEVRRLNEKYWKMSSDFSGLLEKLGMEVEERTASRKIIRKKDKGE